MKLVNSRAGIELTVDINQGRLELLADIGQQRG
jgi:hypothetical protein